jgi:hypothetical protein
VPYISATVSGAGGGAAGALLDPEEAQALSVSNEASATANMGERLVSDLICFPLVDEFRSREFIRFCFSEFSVVVLFSPCTVRA